MTTKLGRFSFHFRRSRKLVHLLLLLAIGLSTMGAARYQPEALPYPVPTNLTATTGQPTQITLEWDSAPDALLGYFEIHPSLDGAGMSIIEVPYYGGGHYSYTIVVDDTQFHAYYDYSFQVRACPANRTACSDPSNVAVGSAIISPPYVFASDGTHTDRVEITFPEYVDGADRIYEVYRADSAAGPYTLLGDFRTGFWGSDPNLFVDSTVVAGTTYYYKGVICNSDFPWEPGHCSEMSTNAAQGFASVSAPGINATDGTSHQIEVSWPAVVGAVYYDLYRTTTNIPPDTSDPAAIYRQGLSGTSWDDAGMAPYTEFYYWVRAGFGSGVYSALSGSDSGWRIYDYSYNVAASDGTSGEHVALSWDNDDAVYIDAYIIYRADSPTGTPVAIGTSPSSPFYDTSAVPNNVYSYWVQACDFPDISDPVLRCSGLAGPDSGSRNAGAAPTINAPASSTIAEDASTGALAFTVGDADTNADLLVVTGSSSNTTLLPDANIALAGSGTSRTVTLTPAANQNGSALVTLTVDDGFNTTSDTFTLTVNPANDAPTDMTLSGNTVAENQPVGTVVGTLSTTDIDTGDSHSYSLVAGTGDSGNGSFAISGNQLRTAAVLDHESQDTYSVRVRTNDGHGGTYDEVFSISVTDANDAPHDISLSSTSVAENQPVGTAVGTLSGQDQDGDSLTFALVPGTGDTGNASFDVDGTTLRTQAVFDYETQDSYSIRLQADDGNGGTYEEVFTINIADADEVPPQVSSIVRADPNPTAASSVDYTVTFSESVTGVDVTDFSMSMTNVTGGSPTGVSGSGDTYTVTVNTGTGSGTIRLDLIDNDSILDLVGNPLAGPYTNGSYLTGEEYTIDRVAPVVSSITRLGVNPTNAASVDFQVTFSKVVTGVDTADFAAVMTGLTGASVTGVSGSGDTYTVSVNTGSGSGWLGLEVSDDDSIQDALGNALGGTGAGNGDYAGVEEYYIDRTAPVVLQAANAAPGGSAVLTVRPTSVEIEFSEPVLHDGSLQAANHAVNYLLLQAGANGVFDMTDCADSTPGDDILLPVGPVAYDDGGGYGPFLVTLTINGGAMLPLGEYRLQVCGTTSIEDLAGNELNSGASDAVVDFSVVEPNLPATGFAPLEVTIIPAQPAERAYASMESMWLEIPSLGVMQPIMGVPAVENEWDLTWLGARVGYLEGTAFPTWSGNTALTAHVTTPDGAPGTFAELMNLAWDDEIIIHAGGAQYVYAVRSNAWYTDPGDIRSITQHEDVDWITLITCRGFDAETGAYRWRTVVRAVRVGVQAAE